MKQYKTKIKNKKIKKNKTNKLKKYLGGMNQSMGMNHSNNRNMSSKMTPNKQSSYMIPGGGFQQGPHLVALAPPPQPWAALAPPPQAQPWAALAPPAQAQHWAALAPPAQAQPWAALAPPPQAQHWAAFAPPPQAQRWAALAPPAQAQPWAALAPPAQPWAALAPPPQAQPWAALASPAQVHDASVASGGGGFFHTSEQHPCSMFEHENCNLFTSGGGGCVPPSAQFHHWAHLYNTLASGGGGVVPPSAQVHDASVASGGGRFQLPPPPLPPRFPGQPAVESTANRFRAFKPTIKKDKYNVSPPSSSSKTCFDPKTYFNFNERTSKYDSLDAYMRKIFEKSRTVVSPRLHDCIKKIFNAVVKIEMMALVNGGSVHVGGMAAGMNRDAVQETQAEVLASKVLESDELKFMARCTLSNNSFDPTWFTKDGKQSNKKMFKYMATVHSKTNAVILTLVEIQTSSNVVGAHISPIKFLLLLLKYLSFFCEGLEEVIKILDERFTVIPSDANVNKTHDFMLRNKNLDCYAYLYNLLYSLFDETTLCSLADCIQKHLEDVILNIAVLDGLLQIIYKTKRPAKKSAAAQEEKKRQGGVVNLTFIPKDEQIYRATLALLARTDTRDTTLLYNYLDALNMLEKPLFEITAIFAEWINSIGTSTFTYFPFFDTSFSYEEFMATIHEKNLKGHIYYYRDELFHILQSILSFKEIEEKLEDFKKIMGQTESVYKALMDPKKDPKEVFQQIMNQVGASNRACPEGRCLKYADGNPLKAAFLTGTETASIEGGLGPSIPSLSTASFNRYADYKRSYNIKIGKAIQHITTRVYGSERDTMYDSEELDTVSKFLQTVDRLINEPRLINRPGTVFWGIYIKVNESGNPKVDYKFFIFDSIGQPTPIATIQPYMLTDHLLDILKRRNRSPNNKTPYALNPMEDLQSNIELIHELYLIYRDQNSEYSNLVKALLLQVHAEALFDFHQF